ncbi:MAG: long-chain fatty acid--CoA ligase [Spirochaetes bacterium]|nr:MAG: long-chain fatty acid--CoA ligase [Spirochaetota bacterium]
MHFSGGHPLNSFPENTIAALFQNKAALLDDKAYAAHYTDGRYQDISWREMNEMVHDLGYYLLSRGIKKGDKVGIFSPNRYEWHMAALAIHSIGAVDVPIYATNSAEEVEYILENSDAKLCMAGTPAHLDKVLKVRAKLPLLADILAFDDPGKKIAGVVTLAEALEAGKAKASPAVFDERLMSIDPHETATLIYTSGTTGNPKGVMLTHRNFYSNVRNSLVEMKDRKTGKDLLSHEDVLLSFLPLSHSLERTSGFHSAIYAGAKTAFARDMSTILEDFQLVRPTVIISVPRIYEKIRAGVLGKVAAAPPARQKIFNFALRQAKNNLDRVCRDLPVRSVKYKIADKLVFSKLKAALGMDRMRFAISGGAPLSVSDAEFFIGMGLKILEGFGLTETTPITHYNRPWSIKPGTVGHPIPETEVKIANDGELLIRGPQVMAGYYKNREATLEVFTEDGFFRTGDIGMIDDTGCLRITGRIKDIIVTAGGKNISPQNIENSVKNSRYVEQVAVIGDRRKYCSALVVPAFAELGEWARAQGIAFGDPADLLADEKVQALYRKEIDAHTAQFARVEQIRKFSLIKAEWTQVTGELTPTQKVKRRVIEKKYAAEIESLYAGDTGD